MRRSRYWFFIVLLPLFLLSQCTCNPASVNRGDLNIVPKDEEWRMGEQLAAQLRREVRLSEDPVLHHYVTDLGRQIVAETEAADRPWHFYVVENPAVNAFALPGGHVFVHTGLIGAADNTAELASVMAHEVAHVVARHHTERITKVFGLNAVANLVLGEDPGIVEQIVAQVLGTGAVARFSRTDEAEADRLGLEYMHEAGYEPEAMATMFETLLAQRARRPNLLEQFFASHPLTEDRIDAVAQAAEERGSRNDLVLNEPGFEQAQRRARR